MRESGTVSFAVTEDDCNVVINILLRLENAGMHLKKDKCSFMLPEVQFLGYKITTKGLEPPQGKVKAIREAPKPKNVTQLKSFLRAVNYYCTNLANNLSPFTSYYNIALSGPGDQNKSKLLS